MEIVQETVARLPGAIPIIDDAHPPAVMKLGRKKVAGAWQTR
jgi:hypothetical protein